MKPSTTSSCSKTRVVYALGMLIARRWRLVLAHCATSPEEITQAFRLFGSTHLLAALDTRAADRITMPLSFQDGLGVGTLVRQTKTKEDAFSLRSLGG